ncbi:amino acid adenylation domain-containing protein [Streptomyces sp. NPDC001678]|uniref:non-ribosomal peptide synthetase n=1 Tax=Streptomyces sp. NPDC001678 TaxID=3364599 RepID=UPI00367C6D45
MSTNGLADLTPEQKRALLAERLRGRKKERRTFPASFSQQRMWFLEQLTPGNAAYNIPGAMRVHGALDLEVWRRSCAELVRRHESLRTTFEDADGQPVQYVAETGEVEVTVVACENLRGPEGEDGIRKLAREEFTRPFDLGTGPLLRMKFLRLAPEEHILLLAMHHIAGDLWSTSVAFDELVELYGALRAGREPDLPALPVQYADYAVWQRERLAGDAVAGDLAYWKRTLEGAPATLELPTDRPRPATQSMRGGSRPFAVPGPVMDRLRELSRSEGATPFMTVLSAFLVLLHRYSREEDIVVGVPVAGRGRPEVERLIGLFTNTLALRTDLSDAPTFRELLARVRGVSLGAFAHQELPFERLVEELHPRRDLSRSPVFQVSFMYQNIALPSFDGVGLRMEPVAVESTSSRFDLELQVFDRPDGLSGWFEFNTDLFDGITVERMAHHLELLVENLIADPDQAVGTVPMLAPEEELRLRQEGNLTRREWTGTLLAHRRFAERAATSPEAEALRAGEEVLGYGELDRRANRLAHRLRRLGVGRDVLVGICMERTPEMVVALLAVLKAGGAYVPLDPGFPADRIAFTLEDSALPVLLTQRSVLEGLGPVRADVLCVDELAAELEAEPDAAPEEEARPEDLAYVIYTSGSTGRPKGVRIPHGALANFLKSMAERPGIAPNDALFAVTTLAFDISMLEILLPLAEGARVILADRETAADGERLAAALAASGATMMQATPSTWRMLLEAGWRGGPDFRALAGGEALPAELAQRLLATGVTLWNMYGPTETTIWSSVARVGHERISIGEPIANTELHVMDDEGRLVPPGVPGELYIGGAGLARDYLGRPELTDERFVPHPFPSRPGERLYRTGDLVRRRTDGGIEFLGRLDHQVKLRGYRIELGEIETVLERQPTVENAVVTVREDTPGDQRLVAYVVAGDPDDEASGTRPEQLERLEQWRGIWDTAYAARTGDGAEDGAVDTDPAFDIRGWNSSYTGAPIPAEEMREWVDNTAGLVLGLRPRSVLDVGCGTGLLLHRAAPHCERYWGTDVSAVALARLRRGTSAPERSLGHVELFERAAHDLDALPEQRFDVVVLNSVVQYFSDERYLLTVIEAALRRVAPGGTLVVGDVRSLPLLNAFHGSVELFRAAPDLTAGQLRARVDRAAADDGELVIDPAFFTAVAARTPAVTDVEVIPKRGAHRNEMTRFRYDVLLTVADTDGAEAAHPEGEWLDWHEEGLTVAALRTLLTERRPDVLAVRDVPNARLLPVTRILRRMAEEPLATVAELRAEPAAGTREHGADPEELWLLGRETGHRIDLDWTRHGADGAFDLVARRLDGDGRPLAPAPRRRRPEPEPAPRWDAYVNGADRRRAARLVPLLRGALGESLPDYMIPSAFVLLPALPLTPNGKTDRKALPAPDTARVDLRSAYVAPRGAVEEVVAGIWAEVLGLDRVGVLDDFFDLGGHSLLSTRVVARLRDAFGTEIPLHRVFSRPTVAGLAEALVDDGAQGEAIEKTAELLVRLSALSDEQVEAALGDGTPNSERKRLHP